MRSKIKLYNFDDYQLVMLYGDPFRDSIIDASSFRLWNYGSGIYMPIEKEKLSLNDWGSLVFSKDKIEENPSILDTAKTVYVHPNSTVSRAILAQKYKKSLNPWLADAVVIPNPEDVGVYEKTALFINEDRKLVILFRYVAKDIENVFENIKQGATMASAIPKPVPQHLLENPSVVHILQSQFEYYGPILWCENSKSYMLDAISDSLPSSKIVFDSTIIKSVGNEDNQPTFENLLNINEMLKSSDYATAGAAIKALSTMDYMNYPNSVKLVLEQSWHLWRYNKATDTTAAKYMFKYLVGGTARRRIRYDDKYISQKDYDLFIALFKHFNENDNSGISYVRWLREYPFMYEGVNFEVFPRIKDI